MSEYAGGPPIIEEVHRSDLDERCMANGLSSAPCDDCPCYPICTAGLACEKFVRYTGSGKQKKVPGLRSNKKTLQHVPRLPAVSWFKLI